MPDRNDTAPVDRNVQAVIDRHLERAAKGYRKYGVTTERGDLSLDDWLTHLQEELMDATVYIEAHKQARGAAPCKIVFAGGSIADRAIAVLRRSGRPMRLAEIEHELAHMGVTSKSERGLRPVIVSAITRRKDEVVRVAHGIYALKEQQDVCGT